MSLQTQISDDLKNAMREGRHLERDTLRMVIAALKNRRIELGDDLNEEQVTAVLLSNVKSRKDSAEQYADAGRSELAEKELAEIQVIQKYLPETLSDDEARAVVKTIVEELGLTSKKEMGQLMKALMGKYKGQIDGKVAQRFAAEFLS